MPFERTTGLTYGDLAKMFPEEENVRRELVGGELIVPPSPTTRHQAVVMEIGVRLALYAKERGGVVFASPTDVWLTERDVVEPDVVFLAGEHSDRVEEPFVRGAPDVVAEVSSPSTRQIDLTRKKDLYERHGVPEYWFVDLDAERVEVYRLAQGRYGRPEILGRDKTLRSRAAPGFSVRVEEVLAAGLR